MKTKDTRGRTVTLGSAQTAAMEIARDTGGCVAGSRGADATWKVCTRLRDLELFERNQRTCFVLTVAGRDLLGEKS